MRIMKTHHEPNRLHQVGQTTRHALGTVAETAAERSREAAATAGHEIRGRAAGVGTAARETARSAGDRARATAADQLVRAGKAVEPSRPSRRSVVLRVLLVPIAVAAAVWVVRAVRTRSAASEEASGDAAAGDAAPTSNGRGAREGSDRTASSSSRAAS